jgi:hypothetical protein
MAIYDFHEHWFDHFVWETYRSSLHTVNKTGTTPADPSLLTTGLDSINGAMAIETLTGASSVAVNRNIYNYTVAKQVRFFARLKMPDFDTAEYDIVHLGLRDSNSFNYYIQFLIDYQSSPGNYFFESKPDSVTAATSFNTGIALPTNGTSTEWLEVEIYTFKGSNDATWELSNDSTLLARGTITSSTLPAGNMEPYIKAEKNGTGTRKTEVYLDRWTIVQEKVIA